MNQKSSTNNCLFICNYENKKIINETNTCIDDCLQDKNHFYEFNNKCYDICPFGTKSIKNNLCVESLEETTTNLIDNSKISDTIFKEEITSQKTEGKEEINISASDIKEDVSFQATENVKNLNISTLLSEKIQDASEKIKFIDSTIIQFNMETTIPISNTELKEETYSPTEIIEDKITSSSNLKEQTTISTIKVKEEATSQINETMEDITPQTNERKDKTKTDLSSTQNNIIESSIINNKLSEGIAVPSEIKKDIITTNYVSKDTTSYIEIITNRESIFKDDNIKTEIIEEEDHFIISGICKVEEFLIKACKENDTSLEDKENIINSIKKNIINGNIKSLLINITNEEKKDLTVENDGAIYQITSSDNQKSKKYNNISTLKLGECENKLKSYYNISKDESLLIFKVDVYEEGLFMPIVEYEIYHPYTLEKLNLDICENEKIQISLPVVINDEDIDKHDPTSNYYNDKCYPSNSENGVDIILIDRQNEFINNNLTLCENNCKFIGYNTIAKQALCECDIKKEISLVSNIIIDKDKLISNFKDLKSMINLDIVKCYKILFTKKGLIKNIGSYILLSTIFLFIISSFIFIGKGFNNLKFQIRDIMMIKENNINANKIQLTKYIPIKSKFKNMKQNNKKNEKQKKPFKKKLGKIKNKVKTKINRITTKNNNKRHKNEPPIRNKKSSKNKNNSSNNSSFKVVTNKSLFSQEKSDCSRFLTLI
jgi:hypothetical protein